MKALDTHAIGEILKSYEHSIKLVSEVVKTAHDESRKARTEFSKAFRSLKESSNELKNVLAKRYSFRKSDFESIFWELVTTLEKTYGELDQEFDSLEENIVTFLEHEASAVSLLRSQVETITPQSFCSILAQIRDEIARHEAAIIAISQGVKCKAAEFQGIADLIRACFEHLRNRKDDITTADIELIKDIRRCLGTREGKKEGKPSDEEHARDKTENQEDPIRT